MSEANKRQIAGNHYNRYGRFQVWDAWWLWDMDTFQANILKYIMRVKGDATKRLEDLAKAEHYLQKYKELLTVQLEDREYFFEQANTSWNLTLTQETILRCLTFNLDEKKIQQLDVIAGLIKSMKEEIQKENNNDKTKTQ